MAEKIAVENGQISNCERLVTLTMTQHAIRSLGNSGAACYYLLKETIFQATTENL